LAISGVVPLVGIPSPVATGHVPARDVPGGRRQARTSALVSPHRPLAALDETVVEPAQHYTVRDLRPASGGPPTDVVRFGQPDGDGTVIRGTRGTVSRDEGETLRRREEAPR